MENVLLLQRNYRSRQRSRTLCVHVCVCVILTNQEEVWARQWVFLTPVPPYVSPPPPLVREISDNG